MSELTEFAGEESEEDEEEDEEDILEDVADECYKRIRMTNGRRDKEEGDDDDRMRTEG